mgnify:FL=1|jgi:hypothetical protein|tara:strand:+ start:216 stop:407 length:192 start_codon:yes stop_codon:yes gene_type:complete
MILYLALILAISLFFDLMLYLHFNAVFENQFDLTNKLLKMSVETRDSEDENQTTLDSFINEEE